MFKKKKRKRRKNQFWVSDLTQWLRGHTALAEDLSLVPSMHTGWLTTSSNSAQGTSSGNCTQVHTPTHSYNTHSHTYRIHTYSHLPHTPLIPTHTPIHTQKPKQIKTKTLFTGIAKDHLHVICLHSDS